MTDGFMDAPLEQPTAEQPAYDPFSWSDDIKAKWDVRIRKALEVQAKYHPWWEASLKNYAPRVDESPDAYTLRIRTNRAFVITERKEADLFYQQPEVQVSPSPLLETIPNHQAMVAAHATIINAKLGLNGVNVKAMAQEAIFNYVVLGQGPTKVFYRAYTSDVTRDKIDPITQQPEIDPMTQMPVQETIPVPVKTKCGWESFSPRQLLIPDDFRSKDFDENAPWGGRRFTLAVSDARSLWGAKIPTDFQGSGSSSKDGKDKRQYFDIGGQTDATSGASSDVCTGTEVFFRSCIYRTDIKHPDHLTMLVMIDGIDEPVEFKDSPDQTVITPEWIAEDPARAIFKNKVGDLTPDSLIGFPYETLIIRVLTDSAYVMGDVAVALPLTQELDKTRAQEVRQRDINLVKFFYDPTKLPTDNLNKMVSADQGGIIEMPTEFMLNPDQAFRAIESTPVPPSTYRTSSDISNDLDQTFGIDAEASGVSSGGGGDTATEKNIQQANRNVRSGKEQGFTGDWFIRGVTKFSTLVQRYMTVDQAAEYVGRDQAIAWDQWRKMIPTRLAFHIAPDSSLRNDTPLERMQLQQLFSYLANEPRVNRRYLLERLITRSGLDATRALIPEDQIPPPKKEDPKISFSFKGEDLSPLAPQSPIVLSIIQQTMKLDPAALAAAQALGADAVRAAMAKKQLEGEAPDTEHGGKLAPMESLDKHLTQLTGGQSNTGAMLPGMSGNIQ